MPRARLKKRNMCHYCGIRPGTTTDHIVPRAFSGPDSITNFVSSCETCNLEKGAKWPTCTCPKCLNAVDNFLAVSARKEKALHRLASQKKELESGINAMHARIRRLTKYKNDLEALQETIRLHVPQEFEETP